MTTLTNTTVLLSFLQTMSIENALSARIAEITKLIKEERDYHTMIFSSHTKEAEYYNMTYNQDEVLRICMQVYNISVMNFRGQTSYFLWRNFNRELFALVTIWGNEEKDKKLLQALWTSLRRSIKTRLFLVAGRNVTAKYLRKLLEYCVKRKAFHVAAVKDSEFLSQEELYVIQLFPKFSMLTKKVLKSKDFVFYDNPIKNMHGRTIRIAMNKDSNKAFSLGRKANGEVILGGYVGHLIAAFARQHNATIEIPNFGDSDTNFVTSNWDKLVEEGIYDMSAELSINLMGSDMDFSQVYDYMDWCIMIPVGKEMPGYMFYTEVFDMVTFSLIFITSVVITMVLISKMWVDGLPIGIRDLLLCIYILNGLVGNSYKMEHNFVGIRSCLYIMVSLAGIIFNTTFVTYLQSYKTQPPTLAEISSLEAMKATGMRYVIQRDEFALLDVYGNLSDYKAVAKVVPTFRELYELRDNYNPQYFYAVTSAQWPLYEEQQKFFSRPLFRLSDMCFVRMLGLGLSLQVNSTFKDDLDILIDRTIQSGLKKHWKEFGFLEALQMKRMRLLDMSVPNTFEPVRLEDITQLVIVFAVCFTCSFACFIAELYWPNRGKFLQKTKRYLCKRAEEEI
ncbi:uncharacterized protein [Musca autumnalis]|uniref:uncharacterized protein n=1 Tax=Musca autumnalis TaxID=221902 RepID=UPI003CE6AF57